MQAFALSDVQAMLAHAQIVTTMRDVHHPPGKDDAAKLSAAFNAPIDFMSQTVSRNREIEAQLSVPEAA